MEKRLTNLAGLARYLKLSQSWLRQEAEAGRIPSLRVGAKRVFNVGAVEETLALRAAESSSQFHVNDDP